MGDEELIKEYISSLISLEKASQPGNYKTTNELYNQMLSYYVQLKRMGPDSVLKLKRYLTDDNEHIRCTVAAHLLPYDEDNSIQFLSLLSQSPSLEGFNAKMTLKEWRNGNLKKYLESL